MCKKLDLTLFGDSGHRFNDNLTESMSDSEIAAYLLSEGQRITEYNECEVSYGIFRELVWRAPHCSASVWKLLAECAQDMGLKEEAKAAKRNADIL